MTALLFGLWLVSVPLADDERAPPAAAPVEATDDAPATAEAPTLEAIFRPPRLLGQRPTNVAVSGDGRWVTYAWTAEDDVEPERDVWLAATDGSEARVLFSHDDGATVRWMRDGARLVVERDGWIERLDVDGGGAAEPLFEVGGELHRMELLEDGRHAVFTAGEDNQLWVLDLVTGRRSSPASHLSGRSSWFEVAEDAGLVALWSRPDDDAGAEERDDDGAADDGDRGDDTDRRLSFVALDGSRDVRSVEAPSRSRTHVSPNGRWAAFSRTSRGEDRGLILADYLTEHVSAVPVRSSLAGDEASSVTLSVVDVESGESHVPPVDEADRYYLRRVEWSPDGERLLVERVSNDFHVRQVLVVEPATRSAWPVVTERDEAWIGGPFLWADWSDDGTAVLFTSERSGFNHLYRVPVEGGDVRALTSGELEVRQVQLIEGTNRALLVSSADGEPATRQLHLVDETGALDRRLTSAAGCVSGRRRSSLSVSTDGTTVAYLWETLGTPADLYALRLPPATSRAASNGHHDAPPVRLTDTVPEALGELCLPSPEIVEYSNPDDGATVRAYLYLPEPFDPERRYPAVVFIHGAGYLQNVLRSMSAYDVNMLFHHRLARKGYVVLDPDYRHSAGYGRDFRTDVHGFMGGKDLDDVVAGVDFLGGLGYVDTERVGIYGGSYGGFMTLMALFTRPEVFACGAALRSVTDWRVYNHWYTNPRLGDPEEDAENYARSSPIDHAEGLERPLLLLHGLRDSNVFAQDTIRLMERLIQLGKDFEVMLYPSQDHGFTDPASWIDEYGRIERFFDRHLGEARH